MKKPAKRMISLVLLFFVLWGQSMAVSEILPLSEVKSGMKAKGKSVFEGKTIGEFDAEILGILANVQPKRSIILARLSGQNLEETGVIEGMSGSPVYVNGKLIGAVAYGFAFSKDAIAGITPIEEMLAVESEARSPETRSSIKIPLKRNMTLEELSEITRSAFSAKENSPTSGQVIVPLNLPLVINGFTPKAFDKARTFFAPLGFHAVRSGSISQSLLDPQPVKASLREGDAVGIQLVGGDMDVSAIGTVTYVDGSEILAFGHPFYNLGAVDYAMTRADVLTVLSSLNSSFKLATAGEVIGRFTQDRTGGAYGEIGKLPKLIPLNISLMGESLISREFKLKIIDDKILSAALVNMAVYSLLGSEERTYGNLSVDFDGDVYLEQGMRVHLEDLFSGNYDSASVDLSGLLASVVFFLNNNDFQDIGIYRIDLNIRTVEEARFCILDKVLLDKYEVSPGERVNIKVYYRTNREESLMEEVTIVVPNLPEGSEFQLIVGDASSMQAIEQNQFNIQTFVPRSLNQLIRILSNLRKNNRIYFKIIAPKPGLFLKGEEMPNLPPSLKTMFTSPRAAASSPRELTRSTLSEYQLPVPFVFRGSAVIPIKIRD